MSQCDMTCIVTATAGTNLEMVTTLHSISVRTKIVKRVWVEPEMKSPEQKMMAMVSVVHVTNHSPWPFRATLSKPGDNHI